MMERRGQGTAPRGDPVEQQLRDRVGRGDSAAFGELLRHHQERIFTLVVRMVGRRAEAAEVTQEVFLQAFKARSRYDLGRPFRPWLYKIALNVCRNHLRLARRREIPSQLPPVADALWADSAADAESSAVRAQTAAQLERLLRRVSDKDREVLLLRFTEDMTYSEVCRVVGGSEAAVKMRVHRALKRLRELAEEELQ